MTEKAAPRSIFVLKSIDIVSNRYPCRKIYWHTVGIYSDRRRAEAALQRMVEVSADELRVGFVIYEKAFDSPVDDAYSRPCNLNISSYTPDGKPLDVNRTPDDCKSIFPGRHPDEIRFHCGDIVETVQYGRYATLGIVAGTPPTEADWQAMKDRAKADGVPAKLDYSDDSYLVYAIGEGDTHEHVMCCYAFPPSKPVSKALRKKLIDKLDEMRRLW